MPSFVPFDDKIEVEPSQDASVIAGGEGPKHQSGVVVSVGAKVTFVAPGDTLFFDAWGCAKTEVADGRERYVVPERSEVILGKISRES